MMDSGEDAWQDGIADDLRGRFQVVDGLAVAFVDFVDVSTYRVAVCDHPDTTGNEI
jgi:hypothetical protein